MIFGFYGGIAKAAGSGIIYIFVLAGIVSVANALVFSHLSTLYPLAGGGYSIAQSIGGPFWGMVFLIWQLVLWASAVSVMTGLAAGFLHTEWVALPIKPLMVGMVVIIFLLALSNIRNSGWVSTMFLVLEGIFVLFWIGFGFTHMQIPVSSVFAFPPHFLGHNGHFSGVVSLAALATALPLAIYSTDGYEWAISFSEEMAKPRVIRQAVVLAAVIATVVFMIGVPLLTLVDVHFQTVANAGFPGVVILKTVLPAAAPVLVIYAAMSSFNAALANFLQSSRLLFAGGRDEQFGVTISRKLRTLNRNGVPYWATIVWLVPSLLLAILSSLNNLFVFTSVVLVVDYILMALGAVWFYVKAGHSLGMKDGAFRWFPLVPLIVIVSGVFMIVLEPNAYIGDAAGLFAVACLVSWIVHRRIRPSTKDELLNTARNAGSILIPPSQEYEQEKIF